MKRFFICGTDTDCGKTWVSKALLAYFNQNSIRALGIKPLASGCIRARQGLISEDALQLQTHTGLSLETINPWSFEDPVSPHIAAEKAGKPPLSAREIAQYCLEFSHETAEYLLIEGAGGLMVPLNNQEFWTDFLKISQIPLILVVGIKTGCINHALLTQSALESQGISFHGWVANGLHPEVPAFEDNIKTLEKHLKVPLLARVEFGGDIETLDTELFKTGQIRTNRLLSEL